MASLTSRDMLQHAIDTDDHELAALTIATASFAYLRILQEENDAVSLPERLGQLCKAVTANAPAPQLAPATIQG